MARETLDDLIEERFPGHNLEDVAVRMGMTARGLWNIRTGRVSPRRMTINVFCSLLKVSEERLEAALKASAKAAAR